MVSQQRCLNDDSFVPVILVRAGENSAALLTDEMLASQEIVVKSVGAQLAGIQGISGATILGDGSIVLILDINALVRTGAPVAELKSAAPAPADERPLAMVVDDSITVRRVMEKFLERNGPARHYCKRRYRCDQRHAGCKTGHYPARHRNAEYGWFMNLRHMYAMMIGYRACQSS